MERILGPAPALPVALATPMGRPAPVPPAGAPDSTPRTVTPTVAASLLPTRRFLLWTEARTPTALPVANSLAAPDGDP